MSLLVVRDGVAHIHVLQREVECLKKFQHPKIVKYINLVISQQHINLVLECVFFFRSFLVVWFGGSLVPW